jgi:hypothetical protein
MRLYVRVSFPATRDEGNGAAVAKATVHLFVLADVEVQPEEVSSRVNPQVSLTKGDEAHDDGEVVLWM